MSKLAKNKAGVVAEERFLTPKQEKFLALYYDVESKTFANTYASAVSAGYSESYARVLTTPAIGNLWVRQNNTQKLTEDHITRLIEKIAMKGNRQNDQLRALELLARFKGMVVDKSENKNLNIETSLAELK